MDKSAVTNDFPLDRPTKLGFLVFPGFPMSCLTSIIEPLRAANEITRTENFTWDLISEQKGKVTSSAQVDFDAAFQLDHAENLDLLILLSAPTVPFQDEKTPGRLRALFRHGLRLGAISGGIFPLAACGVVSKEVLSVHWCYAQAFDESFPTHQKSDRLIELGPRVITASGAAAAFELALYFVEERLGRDVATEVACWFQHPLMRSEGVQQAVPIQGQPSTVTSLSPLLTEALKIATINLQEPVAISDIAEQLKISPRHLERSFKKETGQNPTNYIKQIRLNTARQHVMYSNQRFGEIAALVGFPSVSSLAKQYERVFGLTPTEDRNRINLYRAQSNSPLPSNIP